MKYGAAVIAALAALGGCVGDPLPGPAPADPIAAAAPPVEPTAAVDLTLQVLADPARYPLGPQLRAAVDEINEIDRAADATYVRVFVQMLPPSTVDLAALGARDVHQYGPVYTALVPAARLDELARVPGLLRARAARRLRPLLEVSVPAGGGNLGLNLAAPGPTYGPGAVVGVVDSGMDATHPDLRDASNNSRIVSMLNQNTGVVTNPSAGQSGAPDTDGHGTHVTGTAAGNGRGNTSPKYIGVAAGAPIVGVATTFTDTAIVEGVAHVFTKAAALGLPAVVNLSLGGHSGPHDGTDPFDLAIDELSGPGRVVVAAAGNEGTDLIHAQGTVTVATSSVNSAPRIRLDFLANTTAAFDLYHDSPNGVRVWLRRGNGTTIGPVEPGFVATNNVDYILQNEPVDPVNGKSRVYVVTVSPPSSSLSLNWQIRIAKRNAADPSANFHIWNFYSSPRFQTQISPSDGDFRGNSTSTIGSPATAFSTIAVGAYVTRTGSPNYGALKNLASFSSRGPTPDGRTLDIAAPGSAIISAMSHDVNSAVNYQLMSGTSMAAPHVTGLVALLLERNSRLGPDGVRSILAQTARFDGGESPAAGALPSNDWGYGKATAGAAMTMASENRPSLGGAAIHPASVGVGTTLTARPGTFTARRTDAAHKVFVQWQKQVSGDFKNIAGATQRYLAPDLFAAGNVVRALVTPIEEHVAYRGGSFAGAAIATAPVTIGSDTTSRAFAGETGWSMVAASVDGAADAIARFSGTLYRWDEPLQAYQAASSLARGVGYFVSVGAAEGLLETASAAPAPADFVTPVLTRSSSLYRPGRHLLGNPFNKRIYWQNLQVSVDGVSWQPVTSSSLAQVVYYGDYNNVQGQYLMNQIGGLTGAIAPWQAFWVVVNQAVRIKIPAAQPTPPGLLGQDTNYALRRPAELPGGGLAANEPEAEDPYRPRGLPGRDLRAVSAWTVRLRAHSGALRDDYNYVGLHHDALGGADPQDILDGGTMGASYVVLSIDRTDRPAAPYAYCRDIQPLSREAVRIWPLQVKTRGLSVPVVLSWERLPVGWRLVLFDMAKGTVVEMGGASTHTFTPSEGEIRRFWLLAIPHRS